MADSEEELHDFAVKIGLKREWFQQGSVPHYDLVPSRRQAAVDLGAQELTRATFRDVFRRLRQEMVDRAVKARGADALSEPGGEHGQART